MSDTSGSLRVCLVALNAYPAIDPQAVGPIGGIETRAWTFARGLAQRAGFDVSMVIRHSRYPRRDVFDGVRLITLVDRLYRLREAVGTRVRRTSQFPGIRIHSWHIALLWQLPLLLAARPFRSEARDPRLPDRRLSHLDVDVWITFGVQSHSAAVIASAHSAGRPAVLVLGSDSDLDEHYRPESDFVSPYGDRGDVCYGILQQADAIVAQTNAQQETLEKRFGREATIIENPIDVRQWDERSTAEPDAADTAGLARFVLWIGRAESTHKRPQVCLDLARICPEIDFLMVLNPREADLEARMFREAPRNVRIVRHVPFTRMSALFSRAAALVNTSSLEGFPNVFLQAAVSRTPIASLNVGAEFLEWLGAGFCAGGDLERLAGYLRTTWTMPSDSSTLTAARERVSQRYGIEGRVDALIEVLRSAARK